MSHVPVGSCLKRLTAGRGCLKSLTEKKQICLMLMVFRHMHLPMNHCTRVDINRNADNSLEDLTADNNVKVSESAGSFLIWRHYRASKYKVNLEHVAIIIVSILYVLTGSYGYCTVKVSVSAYYYAKCTSYISATSAPLRAHAICVTNWYFVDGVTAIFEVGHNFSGSSFALFTYKRVLFILSHC